jgi:hypothetical protein
MKILVAVGLLIAINAFCQNTYPYPSSGGVGIGTTSPNAPFHVKGSGQAQHLTIETAANGEGDLSWFQGGTGATNQRAGLQVNIGTGDFEGWVYDDTYNWKKWLQVNRVTGNVGIGTSGPGAKLEVANQAALGTTAGYQTNLLLQRASSYGNTNYFMNNLWVYRYKNGANWTSTALHDGISIDVSFLQPGVSGDSRVWWERRPADVAQRWGDGNITHMILRGANPGTGVATTTLEINGNLYSKEVKVDVNAKNLHRSKQTFARSAFCERDGNEWN